MSSKAAPALLHIVLIMGIGMAPLLGGGCKKKYYNPTDVVTRYPKSTISYERVSEIELLFDGAPFELIPKSYRIGDTITCRQKVKFIPEKEPPGGNPNCKTYIAIHPAGSGPGIWKYIDPMKCWLVSADTRGWQTQMPFKVTRKLFPKPGRYELRAYLVCETWNSPQESFVDYLLNSEIVIDD